jgi:hypothetical protein
LALSDEIIKTGTEIPPLSKTAYQRALIESEFKPGSIHRDDFTRSKGYKGALVSGLVLTNYVAEMLLKFFGPEWMKGGKLTLTFSKPGVQLGDEIVCRGVIAEKVQEKGITHLTVNVWMEKDKGIKVVTGTAEGTLPSR